MRRTLHPGYTWSGKADLRYIALPMLLSDRYSHLLWCQSIFSQHRDHHPPPRHPLALSSQEYPLRDPHKSFLREQVLFCHLKASTFLIEATTETEEMNDPLWASAWSSLRSN